LGILQAFCFEERYSLEPQDEDPESLLLDELLSLQDGPESQDDVAPAPPNDPPPGSHGGEAAGTGSGLRCIAAPIIAPDEKPWDGETGSPVAMPNIKPAASKPVSSVWGLAGCGDLEVGRRRVDRGECVGWAATGLGACFLRLKKFHIFFISAGLIDW
jgi:hypothetical protein